MRWLALVLVCLVLAGCASPPPPSSPPPPDGRYGGAPLPPGDPLHREALVVDGGLAAEWTRTMWLNGTTVLVVGNGTFPQGSVRLRDNVTFHNGSAPSGPGNSSSDPAPIWYPGNGSSPASGGNDAGQAWFLVDPPQPLTGHPVRFTAVVSSASPPVSHEWSFGLGGERKAGDAVTHVFRTAGPHTVTLTVRTEDGHLLGASTSLQVLAEEDVLGFTVAPVALLYTGGQRVLLAGVGDLLQFEATGSAAAAAGSLAWSFGDGATASGPGASHAYAGTGNYSVDLTATRADGSTLTVQKRLQVRNEMPFADFRPEPRWESGMRVINASAWDPDGRIVSYRWDVDNRTVSLEPRLLLEPGRHWVTLTVTDEDGATASRSAVVDA